MPVADGGDDPPRLELRRTESGAIDQVCRYCRKPLHEHDKKRVYPDDGPPGSYHYHYLCPGTGFNPSLGK